MTETFYWGPRKSKQPTNLFFVSPVTEKRFSVQQSPLLIAEKSAELFCSYTSTRQNIEAMKATLFKGTNRSLKVCSVDCNTTCQTSNGTGFNCQVTFNKTEKVFIFNLQNLQVNQTDIYICKIEVILQPPYESDESHGTVIHVIAAEPDTQQEEPPKYPMAMIAAVGALSFYNMLITAVLFHCWFKNKKNRIIRNDYFNMIQWQESNGPKKRHRPPAVLARDYTAYRSWEP
ncbi:T-cell-specific surface glycoprotein CD28 [Tiliqua scincoides]|uniref:T-cell-specific surface glycoprotein CD28 n=1 Tax=Tiliqua scincoides TaxID=71010 RepID=UPI003462B12B